MNVLVTGGAGYVGSVLMPMLLGEGHHVVLLERFMWGVKPLLHLASDDRLQIVEGDIRDTGAVRSAAEGCDAIIHLAAIVGYPACAMDPHRAVSTNVEGTRNIVEALGGRKLIFASTGSTYGKVDGICTEETPIAPLTLYGSSKSEAEKMVTDKGGVGLRLATVFGVSPRMRLDLLVNDFVYQALHNRQIVLYEGHFRRTFLDVTDAARSFVFALNHYDKMKGETFNVGDEAMNYTKREVAKRIGTFVDYYLHEADVGSDSDKRDYEVSYAKIRQLGYTANTTLDEGIRKLVKVLKHVRITSEWSNV
ncbi:MAG: NAD(P)-dependent oxidoreductase [Planctomycetes bacterium]|nr:NAD(P)-dependent oxidoreductase [Planctomycetota bacterium]